MGVVGNMLSTGGRLRSLAGQDERGQGKGLAVGAGRGGRRRGRGLGSPTLDDACGVGGGIPAAAALRSVVWPLVVWILPTVFIRRGRVRAVEGEVLPIYRTVLFDPRIVGSPTPSQAHRTPKR